MTGQATNCCGLPTGRYAKPFGMGSAMLLSQHNAPFAADASVLSPGLRCINMRLGDRIRNRSKGACRSADDAKALITARQSAVISSLD